MLVISIWSSFGELLVRLKKMVYTSRNLHSNDLRLDVEQQLCMVSRARRGAPDLSFEAVLLQWHRAWEVRSRLATGPWQISAGFPHWVAGARKLASAQASSNHGEFAPASTVKWFRKSRICLAVVCRGCHNFPYYFGSSILRNTVPRKWLLLPEGQPYT